MEKRKASSLLVPVMCTNKVEERRGSAHAGLWTREQEEAKGNRVMVKVK